MLDRWLKGILVDETWGTKMRLLSGPRQCGKTTLSRSILNERGCGALEFNWDLPSVRALHRSDPFFYRRTIPPACRRPWVSFDEIQKVPRWKNVLKACFDADGERMIFLVTGSARLDMFRRAGDALTGRYLPFRLGPLLAGEIAGLRAPAPPESTAHAWVEERISSPPRSAKGKRGEPAETIELLLAFGPFPEPQLKGSGRFLAAWRRSYVDSLVRGDLRDLAQIRNLDVVEALVDLLPSRVGSPFSTNAAREELEVAFATVKGMLAHLERICLTFSIPPFSGRIGRPVRKAKKIYLYDWSGIEDRGARFENFVAHELMGLVRLWTDSTGEPFDLAFVRNREGKESDFLILRRKKPWCLFEAKVGDGRIESHHLSFARSLGGIPFVQLVGQEGVLRVVDESSVAVSVSVSASRFFVR